MCVCVWVCVWMCGVRGEDYLSTSVSAPWSGVTGELGAVAFDAALDAIGFDAAAFDAIGFDAAALDAVAFALDAIAVDAAAIDAVVLSSGEYSRLCGGLKYPRACPTTLKLCGGSMGCISVTRTPWRSTSAAFNDSIKRIQRVEASLVIR